MDLLMKIYFYIGLTCIAIGLVVNYVEVMPVLQRHKAIGLLSWFFKYKEAKQLEKYKQICISEGRPLFWYHYLKRMPWFALIWPFGGLLLIILRSKM